MANLRIIKDLLREKNITIRDFARDMDMTEQGLQRLIRENSTKVETLEAIASKLNVSISLFFEDSPNCQSSTRSSDKSEERFDKMLDLIASQQRTIEVLAKKTDVQAADNAVCAGAAG